MNLLAYLGFPAGRGKSQIDLVPEEPAVFKLAARSAGLKLSRAKRAFLVEGDDRVGVGGRPHAAAGGGEGQPDGGLRHRRGQRPLRHDPLGAAGLVREGGEGRSASESARARALHAPSRRKLRAPVAT